MNEMELLISSVSIVQSISISLGVGASTLAILNFLVAMADGNIDRAERRMMQVVYLVLRTAMVMILITTLVLLLAGSQNQGTEIFSTFALAQIILLFILYTNATLMTLHIMPSVFGPAIQASTWYTFGILNALVPLGYINFTLPEFFVGLAAILIFDVSIVYGLMAFLHRRKKHITSR